MSLIGPIRVALKMVIFQKSINSYVSPLKSVPFDEKTLTLPSKSSFTHLFLVIFIHLLIIFTTNLKFKKEIWDYL